MAVSRCFCGAGAVEVEAEGAGGFVLAVDDDDVGVAAAGEFERGAMASASWLRGEDGREDLQADVGGEQEGEGGGGEPEVAGVGFVVAAGEPVGEGSDEEAMAVRMSGWRKAPMAWALRSRKWPKERA